MPPVSRSSVEVVAHRGASGYRPEHTMEAYRLGLQLGADAIELDLVPTRDGILLSRHENEISGTTDVADHPEFADRRTTKEIDGQSLTGWFTEDFTLAELTTLRARERLPRLRPANAAYDGLFAITTADEVLAEWAAERERLGRHVVVLLELKHCAYFDSIGVPYADLVVDLLTRHGLDRPDSGARVMCFEPGVLRHLAERTSVALMQLFEQAHLRPADLIGTADLRTYADLAAPEGLAEIATYARGIGVHRELVLPRDVEDRTGAPTALVADAAAVGLPVHVWTLRAENFFLPGQHRIGSQPSAHGDLAGEAADFVAAGVRGLITDQPDLVLAALSNR